MMRSISTCLAAGGMLWVAVQAAGEYREVPVQNGGTIRGRVRVIGAYPTLPPQPVFKQHDVCGATVADERLRVNREGAVANTVVALTDIHAGKAIAREQPVTLDNIKCAFVPHVLSAGVGQMLNIHNSDPFLHDAHALLGSRTLFNVAVPKDRTVRKPLAEPGLVHINCNVRHTWMHAYLYIAEHGYHAVTGVDGQFRIDEIPPGTYTLRIWHELLGSVDRAVTVEAGKTATIDVELPASAPE